MPRMPLVLALATVSALLAFGTVDLARASRAVLDDIEPAALSVSAAPPLLGPIDERGRSGWQCLPERTAAARRARDADLPAADGR